MENPERVLAIVAAVLLASSLPFLLVPALGRWYVRSTIRGRLWASVLGEARTLRLIRYGISPVLALAGLGAAAWALALWRGWP